MLFRQFCPWSVPLLKRNHFLYCFLFPFPLMETQNPRHENKIFLLTSGELELKFTLTDESVVLSTPRGVIRDPDCSLFSPLFLTHRFPQLMAPSPQPFAAHLETIAQDQPPGCANSRHHHMETAQYQLLRTAQEKTSSRVCAGRRRQLPSVFCLVICFMIRFTSAFSKNINWTLLYIHDIYELVTLQYWFCLISLPNLVGNFIVLTNC